MSSDPMLFEGENILLDCKPKPEQIYCNLIAAILPTFILVGFLSFFVSFIVGFFFLFIHEAIARGHQALPSGIFRYIGFVVMFIVLMTVVSIVWRYYSGMSALSRSRYVLTDQRCILMKGVGFYGMEKKAIPYGRIADANILQGFIQTQFGIANVYIEEQMAGMPMPTIGGIMNFGNFAEGLPIEQAEHMVRIISEHVSKKT